MLWRRAVSSAPLASRPNEIWAMDFVSDALFNGKRFRALTVVDAYISAGGKGESCHGH